MKRRFIRMPEDLWPKVPASNKSKWIRDAIRQRLSRDINNVTDEDMNSLRNSTEQLRKVGINLSQGVRLLHSENGDESGLPYKDLLKAIKAVKYDVDIIKEKYTSKG